ncbi:MULTISPECIES: peptidoglycan-binding domain-containing protein [Flavobacterium]|uniref:Peptidoglycan-binding protein n=1 Tax=Flavobacterium jumunjinense TaxID=998845 RepID=A0ABV5GPS7_9FLAO|nr:MULTISPECIES: peptidoglycan-binding domain-containing protein [Flavobacterium]
MKQIIITLLVVILSIVGYNQYRTYKRFHSPGIDYVVNTEVDLNYHNESFLKNYFLSIEDLNAFVRIQWNVYDLDVRNPEQDNDDTKTAFINYSKKLATIKFYESRLIQAAQLKQKGLKNKDIVFFEENGYKVINYNDYLKDQKIKEMYYQDPDKFSLKIGDTNSFVFEIQKKLIKKGFDIPTDGIFKEITLKALIEFQEKNKLYSNGKIDTITLDYLFR